MKICDQYNHLNAIELIHLKDGILEELTDIVNASELIFGDTKPTIIKSLINERFNHLGWTDKVKVGTSNLTISFLKTKTGVCFQLGNVARTYADILKLMQLHNRGIIDVGIICVPHKIESLKMGANYAQYNRLAKEVAQFKDIITVPILVIGLSN
jgi:hypothetical protein